MLKMQQPLSPAILGQGKVTEYRYPPGCSSETSGEVTSILPFFKVRMTVDSLMVMVVIALRRYHCVTGRHKHSVPVTNRHLILSTSDESNSGIRQIGGSADEL